MQSTLCELSVYTHIQYIYHNEYSETENFHCVYHNVDFAFSIYVYISNRNALNIGNVLLSAVELTMLSA